jgi:hypothetical protein
MRKSTGAAVALYLASLNLPAKAKQQYKAHPEYPKPVRILVAGITVVMAPVLFPLDFLIDITGNHDRALKAVNNWSERMQFRTDIANYEYTRQKEEEKNARNS